MGRGVNAWPIRLGYETLGLCCALNAKPAAARGRAGLIANDGQGTPAQAAGASSRFRSAKPGPG